MRLVFDYFCTIFASFTKILQKRTELICLLLYPQRILFCNIFAHSFSYCVVGIVLTLDNSAKMERVSWIVTVVIK